MADEFELGLAMRQFRGSRPWFGWCANHCQ
jgi:hypothetical protein